MNTVLFLISFPIVVALLLLILPQPAVRKGIVVLSTIILTVASVYLVVQYFNTGAVFFNLDNQYIDLGIFAVEIILAVIVIGISLKYKQYLAGLLMLTSAAIMIWFEGSYGEEIQTSYNLFVDNLSLIMTLIIGVISSMIAIFAVGYMKDYHHHHKDVKDRTPFFFFVIFVFLGAMYGVVFANNLMWLYFFWEITTFSSFFLIGYSREEIAIKNAFRALNMNLLGGLGFSIAIVYLFINAHTIELNQLPELASTVVLLPTALLAFAGLTKAAQMPFSSWLLGAMVAPTPVSALLHSSTMIKAGVYLIIRLSPVFAFVDGGSMVGLFVAMVGAVTFVLTSFMAISQSDAKRVLAYSTIANLGLIIVCAGIGTYQLMWAALMLVIFHAIAKSLLFLSVGTVEHNIGDRVIESMDGLITKMPKIAIGMVVGIAGMFLAPFGMLISKWAALEGLVTANPMLTVFVAFGSAATLFFWTKWLGKLLMVKEKPPEFQPKVPATERFALTTLAVLTIGVCLLFPLISKYSLEPFIASIYNQTYLLDQGNVIILLIMVGLMVILPVSLSFTHKNVQYKPQYLAGLNTSEKERFYGSLGLTREITVRSFYLESIFGESKLFKLGVVSSIVLIIIMFGVGII
ncbi:MULTISPECIES: proton-conducting transporter membrane subunit [unclassified Dehalobacter]|uniref:NADH-quinone oxidoreductase subunit 5 family protein n=1 Tax=unclassified Dehalobacter TaxID=2635733 RepID=UPI000E6C475D|nr:MULTISPECIES: proton-conducting transporter membrane subunit [unclassified Dehalobacter]RJE46709.1 NADH dehydrogenase [Dehalobacter sp. MCB1]TCX49330.1 NADH-quinone oxidoreductase subunit L [Dehalobacter sp. 14DCB1]